MFRFAEALEVHDLPLAQELDDIVDVRIITQAEDIVISDAGLLLCCNGGRTTFRTRFPAGELPLIDARYYDGSIRALLREIGPDAVVSRLNVQRFASAYFDFVT